MQCCEYDTKRFFLFWMRIFFGIWFLYVGLTKWILFGPEGFAGYITGEFDKTWSPHFLNVCLAYIIIIAEPLLALFILSGKKQRPAWMLTSLLMFLLLIGQTILMKPDSFQNWLFVVLTLYCAALSEPESFCCKKKE